MYYVFCTGFMIRYKLSCVFMASLNTYLKNSFGIIALTDLHMAMFDISPVAWSAGQSAHYSTLYATKTVHIEKENAKWV